MDEINIGPNLDSMIKEIKLPKIYNKDSILYINSNYYDQFSYEINKDILTIKKIDSIDYNNLNNYNPIDIDIGTSLDPVKIIELDKYYPINTCLIISKNEYGDTFDYRFYNNKLVITRKNKNEGWMYFHTAKIYQGWYFDYKVYISKNKSNNISYNIGDNPNSSIKKINLDYYPIGCSLYFGINVYSDRLHTEYKNNELIIKRKDKNEGWLYQHHLKVVKTKIPRILLQTHYKNIPSYVKDKLNTFTQGWNYIFFNDRDIINFFKCNPLPDFPNIINVFNNIKTGAHKADLFRYYFLYINGGVFLDSDAMIECNLDDIIEDYDFVTVICNCDTLYFNGFICTRPKNIIMYESIKHIYHFNLYDLSKDYFAIVHKFKIIVNDLKNNLKIKLYKEKGDWTGVMPTVDEDNNNKIIFKHYYHTKVIPP